MHWLPLTSVAGLAIVSLYLGRLPSWSLAEWQVLFVLFVLFVAVRGLEESGLILRLSQRIERGRFVPLKLTLLTFFLSMVVTNDAALIVIVPLTLMLNTRRKGMLVILETLAANAGSALTPIGNPQNLFIYWYYGIEPLEFVAAIAPFSAAFLVLLVVLALATTLPREPVPPPIPEPVRHQAWVYAALLVLTILTVLRVLPVWAAVLVPLYALAFDRRSLRLDYGLLVSFLCFFAIADGLQVLLATRVEGAREVFLVSVLSSQAISNVPAALLFAKFTDQWQALLWGVSVGGFGSLVGSLANLIGYKLYIDHYSTGDRLAFTVRFLVIGTAALAAGIALFLALERWYWPR